MKRIRVGDLLSLGTDRNCLILEFKTVKTDTEQEREFIRVLTPEAKDVWIPNVFGFYVIQQ